MAAKMWKEATPDERRPFEEQAQAQKQGYLEACANFRTAAAKWDVEAAALRLAYEKEHPSVPGPDEAEGAEGQKQRRAKNISYVEDDSDLDVDL